MNTPSEPLILIVTSALRTHGRENLGDIAQAQVTVQRLMTRFKHARCAFLANSPNEVGIDETPFITAHIDYLSAGGESRFTRLVPSRVRMLARSVSLIWHARRWKSKRLAPANAALARLVGLLDEADALYVSGAGAFNDLYVRGVPTVWMTIILAMHSLGKPVVLSGQQVGPLENWPNRWLVRYSLSRADLIGVREPHSFREAIRLGLPAERVILTGDDAWDMPTNETSVLEDLTSDLNLNNGFIAAQFRTDAGNGWTVSDAESVVPLLDQLAEQFDVPVVFVSMTSTPDEGGDIATNRAVAKLLTHRSAVLMETHSPAALKSVLSQAVLALGVSNHFLVFASSTGTPSVGLFRSGYLAQKVLGLAELYPGVVLAIGWADDADPARVDSAVGSIMVEGRSTPVPSVTVDCQAAADRLYELIHGIYPAHSD